MDSVQLFLERFIVAIVEASREVAGMWDMLMILPTRETRYVLDPSRCRTHATQRLKAFLRIHHKYFTDNTIFQTSMPETPCCFFYRRHRDQRLNNSVPSMEPTNAHAKVTAKAGQEHVAK
jgi:hypothetical protein